jgi:hypothetical protein
MEPVTNLSREKSTLLDRSIETKQNKKNNRHQHSTRTYSSRLFVTILIDVNGIVFYCFVSRLLLISIDWKSNHVSFLFRQQMSCICVVRCWFSSDVVDYHSTCQLVCSILTRNIFTNMSNLLSILNTSVNSEHCHAHVECIHNCCPIAKEHD